MTRDRSRGWPASSARSISASTFWKWSSGPVDAFARSGMAFSQIRQVFAQLLEPVGVQAGHRADRAAQVLGDLRERAAMILLQDQRLALPRVQFRQRLQQSQCLL